MKKSINLFILSALTLLFTACPYESEVAIDENKTIKINPVLIGKWKEPGKNGLCAFSKKDDFTYDIDFYGKDTTKMFAFFSDINSERFLNVGMYKPEGKRVYYLYRMLITAGNKLYLFPVSDVRLKDIKIASSKQLKEYITKNKNADLFYEEAVFLEKSE